MKNKHYLLSASLIGFLTLGGLEANLMAADTQKGSSTMMEEGTSVQIEADGTKTIKKSDGTLIQIKPDGSKLIKEADGTSVQIKPDGTKDHKKS